ncbi:MAG: penicillin-binding protein 2 [Cyanobacteria bacterium P01_H01_bin.74]
MDTNPYTASVHPKKRGTDFNAAASIKNHDVLNKQLMPQHGRNTVFYTRFRTIASLIAIFASVIFVRLFYIQIVDADALKAKALQTRNQTLTLYNRGKILDRNNTVLAEDVVLYDLYAHPNYFNGVSKTKIARALAPILDIEETKLLTTLEKPYTTIGLKKSISKQTVEKIVAARISVLAKQAKTNKLILDKNGRAKMRDIPIPGLDFPKKNARRYPHGSLAAHVLGYVNDGANVSAGVEWSAAKTLKKKPADLNAVYLDGRGNLVNVDGVNPETIVAMPKAKDVKLTIDARLQYIAERELTKGVERTKAEQGAVVMLNPRNGEILAFAVTPTYSPEQFYAVTPKQLKNWAVSDVYPPGSTFKLLTLASGLENGVIDKDSQIHDTGQMQLGGWSIQNYDYATRGAPGNIGLVDLLVHSSNVASAKIALEVPQKNHYQFLKKLGISQKTGIDLPGESAGLLKPLAEWDESTHGSIGYGYGTATTPIQMAAAISAIANNGIWITPHVIATTATEHRRVMSVKTSQTLRSLMAQSIAQPKQSTVRVEGLSVAGKTGTSRKPKANGKGYTKDIFTSFVGFYPAENPQLLMMVVVDSPKTPGSWGSTVAGPIFKAIATETRADLTL